jgi:hypothetical protein
VYISIVFYRMFLTLVYFPPVGTHTSMTGNGYNTMPPRVLSLNYSLGDPVYASPFVSITMLCCRLSLHHNNFVRVNMLISLTRVLYQYIMPRVPDHKSVMCPCQLFANIFLTRILNLMLCILGYHCCRVHTMPLWYV